VAENGGLRPAVFFSAAEALGSDAVVSASVSAMLQIVPFFAVPFGFARLENCAAVNAQLRELFLQRATEGTRHANPRPYTQRNPQVFESNFQLFKSTEPGIQQVKSFCFQYLLRMVGQLNNYDEATMRRMLIHDDAWFHVTRRGGFFALHNHPMASWSGVYCVSQGQHDADKPSSGQLCFVNPAVAGAMYVDAGTESIKGAYGDHIRAMQLEPGQLVLFPSWVMHDVKPFEGEGERITIAFNCWFSMTPEESKV
jgi:hypothetical protein